nr:ribosomal protein L34 [Vacuolaria virescens]UTE94713.1 ribosomal protein L34 [Vacuolaria virescens]
MTKRTLEGTRRKAIRKSGFRSRMSTKSGSQVLNDRRRKGRKKLTIS